MLHYPHFGKFCDKARAKQYSPLPLSWIYRWREEGDALNIQMSISHKILPRLALKLILYLSLINYIWLSLYKSRTLHFVSVICKLIKSDEKIKNTDQQKYIFIFVDLHNNIRICIELKITTLVKSLFLSMTPAILTLW